MTLCFAAFIRVLRICAKPQVYNKTLCAAVVKTVDEYTIIGTDDGQISRLMSCDYNLSPKDVIQPVRNTDLSKIAQGMRAFLLPLLKAEMIPQAILALQDMALSTASETTKIGSLSKAELAYKIAFDPADFFADIFHFTATEVENKSGKNDIAEVTEEYVTGFDGSRIRLEESKILDTVELDITLDCDDFEAVFRKVDHDEALALKNKSGIGLYYLDISDSAFNYEYLNEYLLDSVGMYVYSRTQIKNLEERKKARSIGIKALRLMKENGQPDEKGTGNELGEMLLFTFMEGGLHAPKLLSKVEITTDAHRFKSKSDSVHLLKKKVNGEICYQLVFGASSISGSIIDAIDTAFEVLAVIKNGRKNERQMVESTLFNNTYDPETTERLKQIIIPSKQRTAAPDMAFGIFIGYTINVSEDDNDDFRTLAVEKMKADIREAVPYIEKKVTELNLTMHSYYFYFLPFNDAENDKKQIMDELLGGA